MDFLRIKQKQNWTNKKPIHGSKIKEFSPEYLPGFLYDRAVDKKSSSGMKIFNNLPQIIPIKVGIDFCGGDGFMAQHFLNGP